MIKIINNQIVEWSLPTFSKLSTGETVSNYESLEPEILYSEGWYNVVEIGVSENCVFDYFETEENIVYMYYKQEQEQLTLDLE